MTKTPLIYRCKSHLVLLDPEWEIRIGTYDDQAQATRAWDVYMAQGRKAGGFPVTDEDERQIDLWRADTQAFNPLH